ncbi:MAG: hypothetical protein HRT99_01300 [Mycoplasmatales bacterium]|nr:hypothetical protein [Mycoplasmatales bacterium]
MKKLITLSVLSGVILLFFILGIVQKINLFDNLHDDLSKTVSNTATNTSTLSPDAYVKKTPTLTIESPAVFFSILAIIWLFVIFLTIPYIKIKDKSILLNFVIYLQIILAPISVIVTPIYLLIIKFGKAFPNDLKILKGGNE